MKVPKDQKPDVRRMSLGRLKDFGGKIVGKIEEFQLNQKQVSSKVDQYGNAVADEPLKSPKSVRSQTT